MTDQLENSQSPAPDPTSEPQLPEVEENLNESRFDVEFPYVPLAAMNPAPYNPREISEEALNALADSLKRNRMVQPLVWNKRTGNLVGGHQRFKILLREGVKGTKTCVLDVDEIEERQVNIDLNNPALQGEFNMKLLAETIKLLKSKRTAEQFKASGLEALAKQLPLFDGVRETASADSTKTRVSAEDAQQEKLERADVKMLQLFFSNDQYKLVIGWVAAASEVIGTENASDTIFTLLKVFNENLKPEESKSEETPTPANS